MAAGFNWLPGWKRFDFNLGFDYLKFKTPELNTDIMDAGLTISGSAGDGSNNLNFPAFNISTLYYNIDQEENDLSSYDLRSDIDWTIKKLTLSTSLDYLKEHIQGGLTVYYNGLPVNKLGLYLHYKPEFEGNSERVEVSIDFFNRLKLAESFFLNLSNQPYLTRNSWIDDLKNNTALQFQENSNQYSVLLNPELSLEYFGPLYLKGYFNFSRQNDRYLAIPDTTGIFELISYETVNRQIAGLELDFKYGMLQVGNHFRYLSYEALDRIREDEYTDLEMNIPYQPEIENTGFIGLNYLNWKLKLEDELIAGREDELGNKMEDLNLINLRLSYGIMEKLEILAEAENILNTEYTKASYLPEEGLQIKAGFRWTY